MTAINSAGITDIGKKRENNEDEFIIDDKQRIYIVADGMGGHAAGEVASKIVVDTLHESIKKFKKDKNAEELTCTDETLSREAKWLLSGIDLANQSVYELSESSPEFRGMGSTVSAILFTDDTLIAANVGDSPIYLIREGDIKLLSVLHTVQAEHAALNPAPAKSLGPKFSHMLTRGMGIKKKVQADISELQVMKDDGILICSDGLSDKVGPDEIRDTILVNSPHEACSALVRLANDRGGDDNITLIVIKVTRTGSSWLKIMNFLLRRITLGKKGSG